MTVAGFIYHRIQMASSQSIKLEGDVDGPHWFPRSLLQNLATKLVAVLIVQQVLMQYELFQIIQVVNQIGNHTDVH